MRLTGAILAGGLSSRMGKDKAFLEVRGTPFVKHLADVLAGVCSQVVIIGDGPDRFTGLGYPSFEDIHSNCGPLGGIHTALTRSAGENVLIAACDLPLISAEVVRYVLRERSSACEISIVHHGDFVQPLLGVYAKACMPALEE